MFNTRMQSTWGNCRRLLHIGEAWHSGEEGKGVPRMPEGGRGEQEAASVNSAEQDANKWRDREDASRWRLEKVAL